ncbi:MAG: dephospho-CoA kinase [Mycoplasma sp.]|nr:dephospho-CoA kinase [Mycoplasma sp.]
MLIVVTGKTNSGKTTILKKVNFKNTIYLDDYVKNNFYIKGHDLYEKIIKHFGSDVTDGKKIITKELGKIVFKDRIKFETLNEIVTPFINELLLNLKDQNENIIVEMAVYINAESKYKDFFDKVILIKRTKNDLKGKFNYLNKDEKYNPISNKEIKSNYIILNDQNIDFSVKKFNKILEKEKIC